MSRIPDSVPGRSRDPFGSLQLIVQMIVLMIGTFVEVGLSVPSFACRMWVTYFLGSGGKLESEVCELHVVFNRSKSVLRSQYEGDRQQTRLKLKCLGRTCTRSASDNAWRSGIIYSRQKGSCLTTSYLLLPFRDVHYLFRNMCTWRISSTFSIYTNMPRQLF